MYRVASDRDVALHFMFNPKLNSTWLNEDHDQILKHVEISMAVPHPPPQPSSTQGGK